jgi:transcriptional regulator with PAS, ATPase and Fis domain
MTDRIAWIVTDKRATQERFEDALANKCGCEVAVIPWASLLEGDLPLSNPEWVLVDMAHGDNWQHLPVAQRRLNKAAGLATAKIAIIDRGYPLAWANVADRTFSASLGAHASLAELPRMLSEAEHSAKVMATRLSSGQRELIIDGRRFFTHTPALFPIFEKIERAAEHDFTVLLVGETGTGKTTFARLIHELSHRSQRRFLTVACGAMPNELMGSELFGHVRGAFTGADRDKLGKFDVADGGTLLLDEIDVLDLEQQANLLRVIETGEFEQVGSNDTKKVDVRVVGASNQYLEQAIAQNKFRADLFFRLNEVKFEIPPLRHRLGDIVPLATEMIEECCRERNLTVNSVHPDYLELLRHYAWPGNIRELRNEVRHSVLFCLDGVLTPNLLSPALLSQAQSAMSHSLGETVSSGLSSEVAKTEQEAIEDMLTLHDFNRAATARALGISRVTLYNKIRKYRIRMKERRGAEEE